MWYKKKIVGINFEINFLKLWVQSDSILCQHFKYLKIIIIILNELKNILPYQFRESFGLNIQALDYDCSWSIQTTCNHPSLWINKSRFLFRGLFWIGFFFSSLKSQNLDSSKTYPTRRLTALMTSASHN